jgi:stage II sporulation protein D
VTLFRTAIYAFVFLVALSLGERPVAAPPRPQDTVAATDGSLEAASNGRLVRIGALSGDGTVSTVPLELYVARVLVGEAEPNAADASLQALAIAARTFTMANIGRHSREGFDLCDTTHCQVWRTEPTAASRRAAIATAGQVLLHNGAPAEVFYSASCGGHTENAGDVWARGALFPYLQGVPDDVHESDTPWRLERSLGEIRDAVARAGARGARLEDVRIEARSPGGRVMRVGLPGLTPDSLTGDQFRGAVGFTELRSTAFSMERAGDRLRFEGRGYGHGVGMCVVGAGRRAQRGETAERILAHYFPSLTIRRFDDLAR